MYVIATAGHVDHGKSTLVRALTGIDTDRWAEEKQRGLTIDLGFAWTTLAAPPAGADTATPEGTEGEPLIVRDESAMAEAAPTTVSIVDVPGHERFIANTLAGLGPIPAVLLVVSAHEGWQRQTTEHVQAISALGISTGVVAATFADLVEPGELAERLANIRQHLSGTTLAGADVIAVSATTGQGLDDLRQALARALRAGSSPAQAALQRLRLWIDRAFSIKGAGTVVTGTLAAGSITVGDSLHVNGGKGSAAELPEALTVSVKAIQAHNRDVDSLAPFARAALNLRGVAATELARGAVLTHASDMWLRPAVVDAQLSTGAEVQSEARGERQGGSQLRASAPSDGGAADVTRKIPRELHAHIGTLATPVIVRPLGRDFARIRFSGVRPPLQLGDRLVLRGPGLDNLLGVTVLDLDPPELRLRGAARLRAEELRESAAEYTNPLRYIARKKAVQLDYLQAAGYDTSATPSGVVAFAGWWVDALAVSQWKTALQRMVEDYQVTSPLEPGLPVAMAVRELDLPGEGLLPLVIAAAKLQRDGAVITDPHAAPRDLGAAEEGIRALEARLHSEPFASPDATELAELGLGVAELAAAERAGRLIRVGSGTAAGSGGSSLPIVVVPGAIATATKLLRALARDHGGEFTLSQARQALGTTRRVAVPLLEYLDAQKITLRMSPTTRTVR